VHHGAQKSPRSPDPPGSVSRDEPHSTLGHHRSQIQHP